MIEIPKHIEPIDLAVIGSYFLLVIFVAWRVVRAGKKADHQSFDNTEDYFLGGRDLGWFVIGASLFA